MEQLLHHIWKYALYEGKELHTTSGDSFEVIDAGIYNPDAGPDFFNAKIRTGITVWVGNVEIHQHSSDWYQHRHHTDKAYDSVILNVVMQHDSEIYRTNGEKIAQFVMQVPDRVMDDYSFLQDHSPASIPCAFRLGQINPLLLSDWKTALGMERVLAKSSRAKILVDRYAGNWEEAFYILLARSFGTGINSDAFERLARSLPLSYLLKHIDSLLQTEAFLFGQAGFLEEDYPEHPYYRLLQREYALLRSKFRLTPLPRTMWKFFRLRPSSFPQVRIACLASLLHTYPRLFSSFIQATSIDKLKEPFQITLHAFWENHYQFDTVSVDKNKGLGFQTVESILINTLVPVLFAYAERTDQPLLEERAICFLEDLKPENNVYVRNWREAGMKIGSAFDSQAILQLQKEYCDKKKCLYCRIGHQLLTIKKSE
ncbi:MAG: DUF2851 family protein [Bacteroidales bacterium]